MRKILLILCVAVMVGCGHSALQNENNRLRAELAEAEKTIEELQNTPQARLVRGQQYFANNDYATAQAELTALVSRFSGTDEAERAVIILAEIEQIRESERIAEERRRTLGFRSITENRRVNVGGISFTIGTFSTSNRWSFTHIGGNSRQYFYEAERGNTFIHTRFTITSEINEPKLPPILVYKMESGELRKIGMMTYHLARWGDFGRYLGNHRDNDNDFAFRESIPFTLGFEISQSSLNNYAIFIVAHNSPCVERRTGIGFRPSVQFRSGDCIVRDRLTVDDFDRGFQLIHIFNRNRL